MVQIMLKTLAILIPTLGIALIIFLTGATTAITQTPVPQPTLNPVLGIIDPSPFTPTTDFPDPLPGAFGPVNFPSNINPLTGLEITDPTLLQRRPIVAKISNAPPLVRPQSGFGSADLVYEHYTEGGLTRFSAVFYSQTPQRVGSIRSARLIDYELTEMYKGLLVFSGASGGVENKLNESEFAQRLYKGVLYGLPFYWRDESIEIPHNMFTNLQAIWTRAGQEGFDQRPLLRGMAFHPAPPLESSGEVNKIDIRYRATRVIWHYNPDTGRYDRTADGKPHFDYNLNMQISSANVVVIYAGHYLTDIIESEFQGSVTYSTQITLWPQGRAELFRDGQHYTGTWVRLTRPDLLGLRTDDGELLYLKPGNTWFQVVQLPEQMNPAEEWVRWE
jgi:hypothetical protein